MSNNGRLRNQASQLVQAFSDALYDPKHREPSMKIDLSKEQLGWKRLSDEDARRVAMLANVAGNEVAKTLGLQADDFHVKIDGTRGTVAGFSLKARSQNVMNRLPDIAAGIPNRIDEVADKLLPRAAAKS